MRRFYFILALVLCVRTIHAASVSSVVINFEDGTQQRVDAPAQAAPAAESIPPATAPTTEPAPRASGEHPFLGVNLESLRDYDRQFMFIDAMKTSRRFGSTTKPFDQKANLSPDGWPIEDSGTLVMTEVKNVNGVYRFYAIGRCDLSCPGTPGVKVQNVRYDERSNRTQAEIVLKAPLDKPITFSLVFKNTSGGLRNIKLLRPGYDDESPIFTREFLASLKPFSAIRFMDYLKTNNSPVVKWEDRCKPADPQYTSSKGGPYEWAIALGNASGKDIWLNIPALADDDFLKQLSQLVTTKLRPDLHCYVEYSNEVWNGIFQQYKQNAAAAKDEVAAGDFMLNDRGADRNEIYWARKRIAKQAVRIKQLLGPDPRFRVVLASQLGAGTPGTMLKQQLEFIDKYFGPPSQFIYAVAGAPYFAPGKDENDPAKKKWYTERPDVTVDGICDRLLARTATSANDNVKAFHALARQYNVKSFAYEGGLDLQQFSSNVDIKMASQYDPRAGAAVEDYLNHWYTAGGDALFYFTLSCKYSKSGYWGLTEDVRDLTTPKYQAAVRVAQKLAAAP